MNRRQVVLVDMDGVLADFDAATTAYLAKNHPDIPIVTDREHFYYRDIYTSGAHREVISRLHASQYFFANLPPVDGALDGWRRIEALGYRPRICSSPLHSNKWCREEKLDWLRRHLGPTVADEAIIDSAKERHDGVALIDDRPVLRNSDKASWQHIVFDQSYNRSIQTDLRISGWSDEKLGEVLAQAAAMYWGYTLLTYISV